MTAAGHATLPDPVSAPVSAPTSVPAPRALADIDDPELAKAYARLLGILRDLGGAGETAGEAAVKGTGECAREGAGCGGIAVAFSGGVDSTLLVVAAREALGERALAVTVTSAFIPRFELEEARAFCSARGIGLLECPVDALAVPGVAQNPVDRCYLCKTGIFTEVWRVARGHGLATVVDGSNCDDLSDYRPGLAALKELGVRSPFVMAGFGKRLIRDVSRALGLPTWDKPSCACLASRVPYGEGLTVRKLEAVDRAEEFLRERGFRQLRVRAHEVGGPAGSSGPGAPVFARIEVEPDDIPRLAAEPLRSEVCAFLNSAGFSYVTLDLRGYRTGSLNEGVVR